jgi:alpha-L-arabinofuranosidase
MSAIRFACYMVVLIGCGVALGQERGASIHVRPDRVLGEVSRFMTGACIEDVNHEVYGGIYSQMIFGESFQEPAPVTPPRGFAAFGGAWAVKDGRVFGEAGEGPKLLREGSESAGDVSADLFFADDKGGNAGLILKVSNAGVGADRFTGYEVSLDPRRQMLVLGRHRQNWEPIREVPAKVPVAQWVTLRARTAAGKIEVWAAGERLLAHEDGASALGAGAAGLRTWQREAGFGNLIIDGRAVAFEAGPTSDQGVSAMWRATRRGDAAGSFALETREPYLGFQSQRITMTGGSGELGVENRGLNRWGLYVVGGKRYEGYVCLRGSEGAEVWVALERGDGADVLAEERLALTGGEWKRFDFALTPKKTVSGGGRFAIKLKGRGDIIVGHAFLQPGEWGRFKGLPVRRDVAEGLIAQGVTVMRLGGSMANAPEYRWKKMLGPRDRRPPYKGHWYPHSSNGWGIVEFLDFCEAAGFLAIPDFNIDESPADMADFVEYVNGRAQSEWGRRRAATGHPEPYRLKYLELGNEEAVDEAYWRKVKPLAEAIWAKDPQIVLIVGDFEYKRVISDPFKFEGAPRITSLAAHQKILELARAHGREVWFDVHIWNHSPRDALPHVAALESFDRALAKIAPGAKFGLCVLEENATNHAMRRAVAHAETVNALMRMGDRVRVVCAANALQPYRQNDNGWDQGLLFLSPSRVWGQPPYYVTQMIAANDLPRCVASEVKSPGDALDVTARTDGQGKVLALQVVNRGTTRVPTSLQIEGFVPRSPLVRVTQIAGALDALDAVNAPDDPQRVVSWSRQWRYSPEVDGGDVYVFPPNSFTVLRFE